MLRIACRTCQKVFLTFPSRLGRKRYCSKLCFRTLRFAQGEITRRFWEKVSIPTSQSSCWLWQNPHRPDYPHFRIGSKSHPAHRISYEWQYGTIPQGLFVLHRCDKKRCVNPTHLFLGTNQDNVDDMCRKDRHSKLWGKDNPNFKHGRYALKSF